MGFNSPHAKKEFIDLTLRCPSSDVPKTKIWRHFNFYPSISATSSHLAFPRCFLLPPPILLSFGFWYFVKNKSTWINNPLPRKRRPRPRVNPPSSLLPSRQNPIWVPLLPSRKIEEEKRASIEIVSIKTRGRGDIGSQEGRRARTWEAACGRPELQDLRRAVRKAEGLVPLPPFSEFCKDTVCL